MVLGVVASITLPTMIADWQKQATVSRLKKVCSTLYGAFNFALAENGPMQTWVLNDCLYCTYGRRAFVKDYLMPYFVYKEYCDKSGNDACGYTWPKEYSIVFDSFNRCLGNINSYFILNDGSVILVYPVLKGDGLDADKAEGAEIYIITDINGSQKPNKLGRDIFFFKFVYNSKDNSFRAVPYMYDLNSGEDSHSRDYYLERVKNGDFISYFGIIWADGWQIKDDYPW